MQTGAHDVVITVTQPGQDPLKLLLQEELVIGRECEGLLVADTEVSRRHLRIRRRGLAVEVADLGSTNGTFLDGTKLRAPQLINALSRFTIGGTTVLVEFTGGRPGHRSAGHSTNVRLVDDLRITSIGQMASDLRSTPSRREEELVGETLTIVFSDIESSTERAAEVGDSAWFGLLEQHNQLFRSELQRWGGREVKSTGDGFFMTFRSVAMALRFAIAIQDKVKSGEGGPDLRVRIGLHTGEAIEDITGDLFGRHVILAARVADLAGGGQILCSLTVREIAVGRDDMKFGDPVVVELKGFNEPQTVFEVLPP